MKETYKIENKNSSEETIINITNASLNTTKEDNSKYTLSIIKNGESYQLCTLDNSKDTYSLNLTFQIGNTKLSLKGGNKGIVSVTGFLENFESENDESEEVIPVKNTNIEKEKGKESIKKEKKETPKKEKIENLKKESVKKEKNEEKEDKQLEEKVDENKEEKVEEKTEEKEDKKLEEKVDEKKEEKLEEKEDEKFEENDKEIMKAIKEIKESESLKSKLLMINNLNNEKTKIETNYAKEYDNIKNLNDLKYLNIYSEIQQIINGESKRKIIIKK